MTDCADRETTLTFSEDRLKAEQHNVAFISFLCLSNTNGIMAKY